MDPVYSAFGGILLGAIASFFPAYLLERLKRKAEIEALTQAIVTEIKGSLFLAEKRRYVADIEKTLEDLKSKRISGSTFQVTAPEIICPIFKANLGKIGLLPEQIRNDVVTFYQLVEAVMCDIRPGGLIADNKCGVREFTELHDIASEAIRVGNRIISRYPHA